MALTDNLISFWELGEVSGSRLDSHGTNHLTPNNTPTQVAGKVGNAVHFTAASFQSLSLTSNTTIQCGDIDFTFCGWFYGDTLAGTYLFCKDNASLRDYYCYADASIIQFAVFISGPTIKVANVAGSFSASTWYFIAAWHDALADTVYLQVNNGTPGTGLTTGSLATPTSVNFSIGVYGDLATSPADGRVDQLGFWKRVLSNSERTWLYNSGAGRSYADIIAESTAETRTIAMSMVG